MAESLYVRNGLIAGFVAGVVTAVITYATLPSVDEVIEAASRYLPEGMRGVDLEALRPVLSLALKLSGLIGLVVATLLGAIFGWIQEVIDKRIGYRPVVSALLAGLILIALLAGPNIALGASEVKTMSSMATGITYTIVLTALAIKGKNRLGGSNWQ